MPRLEAVIETRRADAQAPWPLPSGERPPFVRLHRGMAGEQIGLAIAEIARYGRHRMAGTPRAVFSDLAARDVLVVGGGLLVRNGRRVIEPSCCLGLEQWREWLDLFDGGHSPWMGHDPSPWVQRTETGFRVWSGGGLGEKRRRPVAITFSDAELRDALRSVHVDLVGFLRDLERWAIELAPDAAHPFVRAIDRHFHITPPLGI